MKRRTRLHRWAGWSAGALVMLVPLLALAHERFVKHNLKIPLKEAYFHRDPNGCLGMNPNYAIIATICFAMMATFMTLWFLRQPLAEFVERRLLGFLGGAPQRVVHNVLAFLTDRPVRSKAFHGIGEWAILMFMRSPGLVLMFSATNDSLVMPSYPLDPTSATFFKFAQVIIAVLILTGMFLPLCGAIIFGTWLYLFRWGWMVAADALPVVTVGVLYASAPWSSHKLAITDMNQAQTTWVRRILGFGFFMLGWFKIYNYNLTAGVADNFPEVMEDPMIKMFAMGTDPAFRRENWLTGFAIAEVLTGFLTMIGVFIRLWGVISVFIFTKLMLIDFGWNEIPHIYPIAAFLSIIFSNKLVCELDGIEAAEERAGREGKRLKQMAIIVGASSIIAFLVVYPGMYFLTFVSRKWLGGVM